ncbi:MAG: ASCH domain-containing protein [Neisseriaceae bacterium]|nr:ASCH domain-containing protein [Neisseriaceae bacterium]
MSEHIKQYWQAFLASTARAAETTYLESFYFGHGEAMANELLALVLRGQKTATASSLDYYQVTGNARPQVGDLSIVTDWAGTPQGVIQTMKVSLLKFKDMTYEICQREGEDDTLASWQQNHRAYFITEGQQVGYAFHEDMMILFEDFRLLDPHG